MRQGKKTKARFVKGRKAPQFEQMIYTALRDCTLTLEEMMEKSPSKIPDEETGRVKLVYDQLPDDVTVIDSLNGNYVFKDARLFKYIEYIALALCEFDPKKFCTDEGASVMELRYDKKGRSWGAEPHILGLAYMAIAMGLAEWTSSREEWANNPDKLPKIRFKKPEEETDEQTNEVPSPAARSSTFETSDQLPI